VSPPVLEELRGRADIEILEGELTAFDDVVRFPSLFFPSLFWFLVATYTIVSLCCVVLCCGLIDLPRQA
jgi:hypothetical protein